MLQCIYVIVKYDVFIRQTLPSCSNTIHELLESIDEKNPNACPLDEDEKNQFHWWNF